MDWLNPSTFIFALLIFLNRDQLLVVWTVAALSNWKQLSLVFIVDIILTNLVSPDPIASAALVSFSVPAFWSYIHLRYDLVPSTL